MVKKSRVKPTGGQNYKPGDVIETKDLSPETIEVLEHFGPDAPHLLNQYCIALEDALLEQVNRVQQLKAQLTEFKT